MSLSVIAAAAAAVVGGTGAFFSDSETSTGNTFTAGAIDLKVDSEQHYNGNECVLGDHDDNEVTANTYAWVGQDAYPVPGTSCDGTWTLTDLGPTHQFFDFADVKPGDDGENTISLHVINNDAYMCATVSGIVDADNDCTEPEDGEDTNCAVGDIANTVNNGEMQENLEFTVWKDDGDNVLEPGIGETPLYTGAPQNGTWPLYTPSTGALAGGNTGYLGVAWSLPLDTGNEVQTDSLKADISFRVEQARNNPNFSCDEVEIPEGPLPPSPLF